MLSKCANPECRTVFRYFHLGRLFVVESLSRLQPREVARAAGLASKTGAVRYFWLCSVCSQTMTLTVEDAGVKVVPQNQNARPVQMSCEIPGCSVPTLAHCATCHYEICGRHSKECACCGDAFCPICYREHTRSMQLLRGAGLS
jgi:hypothetical protein